MTQFIPDPQRESFIANEFSPRTMRTPNCWPSSQQRNEKSSVLNEFSRKVIRHPSFIIRCLGKLISNDQFRLEIHNTKPESLVHDWFSRIGNEISAKLIRKAPFLIRCLENSSAIGHCQ